MGTRGTRRGRHIFCRSCRINMASYNYARLHGLARPKIAVCKRCRRLKYRKYGEAAYQRAYKRRVRAA